MASFTLWNPCWLLLFLTAGREMTSASILLKLHGLEDSLLEPREHETAKSGTNRRTMTVEKRQSATGTCTCTCETKPSNTTTSTEWTAEATGQTNRKPQTAPEMIASGLRTDMSGNRLHQVPAAAAAADSNAAAGKTKTHPEDRPVDANKVIDEADLIDSARSDWGHGSRFLWKRLPDRMCYRESCISDKDCCLWYNICDRSAKVCVDCWYGSPCSSERDCCVRYPYCDGETHGVAKDLGGGEGQDAYVVNGQCVDELR